MSHGFLCLVDVDGVLADYVGASLEAIRRKLGRTYTADQVTQWDLESLPGWSDISARYWEIAKSIGFCGSIAPIPGAIEGIARLREVADVEFLTSPMHGAPTWVHERDAWLERHFAAHHRDVMHVRKKERVRGDVLIDDNVDNIASWEAAHPLGTAMLWRQQPYNVVALDHASVDSWDDVLRIVRRLKDVKTRREMPARP